jgi:hypothetical protein
MKNLLLSTTLLMSMVLAGCSSEATIDGTNEDTLKESWMSMYETVPQANRNQFIDGSALMVLDSLEEVLTEANPNFTKWSSLAYIDFSGRREHRSDYAYESITTMMDDKTQTDILAFANSSDIELNSDTLTERVVSDYLR